jgi:hypothetical protein
MFTQGIANNIEGCKINLYISIVYGYEGGHLGIIFTICHKY